MKKTSALSALCILALTTSASAQFEPEDPGGAPSEDQDRAPAPAAAESHAAPMSAEEFHAQRLEEREALRNRPPAPNSIFVEGLGAGLWYSINYERIFFEQVGVRAGFGFVSLSASAGDASSSAAFVAVPITINWIGLRGGKSALELGGGVTPVFTSASASSGLTASGTGSTAYGSFHVGYRLHPQTAGFQFRVGLMAVYGPGLGFSATNPSSVGVIPWGYISFGASF